MDRDDSMTGILGPPNLHTLPYDLLLNIASRLDLLDVHHLHLACKALYSFSLTRPVYRQIANDLLRRSRALPLKGFQRITDLTTQQLIRAVNKATRYEYAWQRRGPRPIRVGPYTDINEHSNYMDVAKGGEPKDDRWFKIVSAPPDEEVDWLSPITSSYTLCATKTGKVVCWDVQTDQCLAEWSPGEKWELWKCRVEFEEKTVYFTMAKVLVPRSDDLRLMEFTLMRLRFSDGNAGVSADAPPEFEHVADFKTKGVVMNVFLLDPIARLLSAFIYSNDTNTICLYALLDWDKPEYIYIDTGIQCAQSSNWSCILYEQNIVIHCEESQGAYQHFYPLHLLEAFTKEIFSSSDVPIISHRVSPAVTLYRPFIFPKRNSAPQTDPAEPHSATPATNGTNGTVTNGVVSNSLGLTLTFPPPSPLGSSPPSSASPPTSPPSAGPSIPLPPPNPNPFPMPPWCPDSAHFVRQWWPSLPGIPRVSCTVILLAAHDPDTHRTRFMLAQHYFRVPLTQGEWNPHTLLKLTHTLVGPPHPLRPPGEREGLPIGTTEKGKEKSPASLQRKEDQPTPEVTDESLMHLWYVDTPFEVVCVADSVEEEMDEDGDSDRPRPLVAVDFGHAAWIEFVDNEDDPTRPRSEDPEAKWLRFVTFPPFDGRLGRINDGDKPWSKTGGVVRTLETPPDLDLDLVETINIDQSQGAVILSVKDGKIYILCYE